MSPAAFLLIAIGLSLVGSAIVLVRAREPKRTMHDTINSFQRELAALSPDRSPDADVRESSRLMAAQRDGHEPPPYADDHEPDIDAYAPPPMDDASDQRRGAAARQGDASGVLWRPEPPAAPDPAEYFGPLYGADDAQG